MDRIVFIRRRIVLVISQTTKTICLSKTIKFFKSSRRSKKMTQKHVEKKVVVNGSITIFHRIVADPNVMHKRQKSIMNLIRPKKNKPFSKSTRPQQKLLKV